MGSRLGFWRTLGKLKKYCVGIWHAALKKEPDAPRGCPAAVHDLLVKAENRRCLHLAGFAA